MTIKEILEQALIKIKDEYGVTVTSVDIDYLNTFDCDGTHSFIRNIEIKAEMK